MPKIIEDRNFDTIADHFEKNIYGSIKGILRQKIIWQDLITVLPTLERTSINQAPHALDVGGGLGYFSIKLANKGYAVHYNDLSLIMTDKARCTARETKTEEKIQWSTSPYQDLVESTTRQYDLILCHALIEWLSHPEQLIPKLCSVLKPGGYLSLCYYNSASIIYRNLIRGNFNWVKTSHTYMADENSLTPNSACDRVDILNWLQENELSVINESGIRVFSDYVITKKGGNCIDSEVIEMELRFCRKDPYKYMGRYMHCIAQKPAK